MVRLAVHQGLYRGPSDDAADLLHDWHLVSR